MPFQVSPGVEVVERDLTQIVPAIATTRAGTAGQFRWGPVDEVTTVDSENELVRLFGEPNDSTYRYFFSAANFLAYSNNLKVVRVVASDAVNAVDSGSAVLIKNETYFNDSGGFGQFGSVKIVARYPGALGNSLRVSVCGGASNYRSTVTNLDSATAIASLTQSGSSRSTIPMDSTTALQVNDVVQFLTSSGALHHTQKYKVYSKTDSSIVLERYEKPGAGLVVDLDSTAVSFLREWEFAGLFDGPPGGNFGPGQGTTAYTNDRGGSGDAIHLVVVDDDGDWTGVADTVLESYSNLSVASDAKTEEGVANYYVTIINDASRYIYITSQVSSASNWGNTASNTTFGTPTSIIDLPLKNGLNGAAVGAAELTALGGGFTLLADADTIDVNLIIAGPAGDKMVLDNTNDAEVAQVHRYIIDNVVEARKDCIALLSPPASATVNITSQSAQDANIREYVTGANISGATVDYTSNGLNRSTSYAVIDTGQKYQYDRYNDTFRYVPICSDIAGLCARTDDVADPWFSPAGYNRGLIKNVVKLSFNPRKAYRDNLYQQGINPVVSQPGQGTLLLGDKTLLAKESAFNRINVRRLFIILEKAIATAAKYSLFEFNDEFTRSQFVALVDPYLRDVQGRRGIIDYKVVCDESNNTAEVIDRNEFVADIYIKPARSINFITLNFIATRSGVDFNEIGG